MTTDTSEKGLETIIMRHMTGMDGFSIAPGPVAVQPDATGTGYFAGSPKDYDRAVALDVPQLFAFLRATQPEAFKKLALQEPVNGKDINRLKFLTRLSAEIGKRGVIDVLRKGVDHGPMHFDLFYGTPSLGNAKAEALHAQNRFSITRQLAYSMDETRRALDLCLFINGLPIATFELKNSLTKQTVDDAVEQYKRTAIRANAFSTSGAASCISPWTTARSGCVPNSRERLRGSFRSTRVTTTARAIRPIPSASRPTISGKRCSPRLG